METFKIKGPFIKLNQLIKIVGWCATGAEANAIIDQGLVNVNGVVEKRRRNKIMPAFVVGYNGFAVLIE
jgi:ribosome-associated protein